MCAHLCRVHRMQLISMKVDVKANVFPSLENLACGIQIKNPFLTKHVNVVHLQIACGNLLLYCRQLHWENVLSCLLHSLPSKHEQKSRECVWVWKWQRNYVWVFLCIRSTVLNPILAVNTWTAVQKENKEQDEKIGTSVFQHFDLLLLCV